MKTAIIVPYRNRPFYLQTLLERLPKYLENQSLDYQIIVSCQKDSNLFNLGLCQNIAAHYAISKDFDNLIIHNVDLIPISGIDYSGTNEFNFLVVGNHKLKTSDFIKINGYDNRFKGWGREEMDFHRRLMDNRIKITYWHLEEKCHNAVILNMEVQSENEQHELNFTESYWKPLNTSFRPRFIGQKSHLSGIQKPLFYNKGLDFYIQDDIKKNTELYEQIGGMSLEERIKNSQTNGLNQIQSNYKVIPGTNSKIIFLEFNSETAFSTL